MRGLVLRRAKAVAVIERAVALLLRATRRLRFVGVTCRGCENAAAFFQSFGAPRAALAFTVLAVLIGKRDGAPAEARSAARVLRERALARRTVAAVHMRQPKQEQELRHRAQSHLAHLVRRGGGGHKVSSTSQRSHRLAWARKQNLSVLNLTRGKHQFGLSVSVNKNVHPPLRKGAQNE